jgi:hypothetical protein
MRLKTYLMLCILTFSIGSGIGFVWPTIAQIPQQSSTSNEETPAITRKLFSQNTIFNYQPDSPLQPAEITAVSYPDGDLIHVSLTNVSSKIIRAYVIEFQFYSGAMSMGKTTLQNNIAYSANYILPGNPVIQALTKEDLAIADKVVVNLDFVEFNDGSSWGKDRTNYRTTLQDFRAGALAATEQLLGLSRQQGPTILLKNFSLTVAPITPLPQERLNNFLHGAYSIQKLLQTTNNTAKAQETLSTLHKEMQRMVEQAHVAQ